MSSRISLDMPHEGFGEAPKLELMPVDTANAAVPTLTAVPPIFLIGKYEPAFQTLDAQQTQRLSRKHAALYLSKGQWYLIDLHSTNQTWRNGQVVPGKAPELLHNDDVLVFGDERFRYRVSLPEPAPAPEAPEPTLEPTPPARPAAGGQTVYLGAEVSDFLDTLVGQQHEKIKAAESAPKKKKEKAPSGFSSFFRQYRGRALALGLLTVIFGGILWGLYTRMLGGEGQLDQYMAKGNYAAALQLAQKNIQPNAAVTAQVNPTDNRDTWYSQEAFIALTIAPMTTLLNGGEYAKAQALPASVLQQQSVPHPEPLTATLSLYRWMSELQAYQQNGQSDNLHALLQDWQSEQSEWQVLMRRMQNRHPPFAELHRNMLGGIGQLAVALSQDNAGQARQGELIRAYVLNDDTTALAALQQRLKVVPNAPLAASIAHYTQLFSGRGCFDIAEGYRAEAFQDPQVKTAVEQKVARIFGSDDSVQWFRQALQHWRQGDFLAATEALSEAACDGVQGRNLAAEYQRLNTLQGLLEDASPEAILRAGMMLDGRYDQHQIARYQPQLLAAKEAGREAMQNLLAEGGKQFQQYQQQGGIDAEMRAKPSVSAKYRRQAARLTKAHQALQSAEKLAVNIGGRDDPALRQRVQDEITSQRDALQLMVSTQANPAAEKKLAALQGEGGAP